MTVMPILRFFPGGDRLIAKEAERTLTKMEREFMLRAPQSLEELEQFFLDMPYIISRVYGRKIRLLYRIYSSPKAQKNRDFFSKKMNDCYSRCVDIISHSLEMREELLQPLLFIFMKSCVYYIIYYDETFLEQRINYLILTVWNLKTSTNFGK